MSKNGADVKATRYFDLKDQYAALKEELDAARDDLVETMRERKIPLLLEGKRSGEVVVTEYIRTTTPWKEMYGEAYNLLDVQKQKIMRRLEEVKAKESHQVSIKLKKEEDEKEKIQEKKTK